MARDIARLEGIGGEDAVEGILQQMDKEGLVQNNDGRWTLGTCFSPPVPMDGQIASLLYE